MKKPNGSGSIYTVVRKGHVYYRGVASFGFAPDGRRIRRTVTRSTLRSAIDGLAALQRERLSRAS